MEALGCVFLCTNVLRMAGVGERLQRALCGAAQRVHSHCPFFVGLLDAAVEVMVD
jgi:hypothetical protein